MEKQIRSNRNKMIGVVAILIFLASWQNEFLYKGIKANLYVNGTIIGAFLFSVVAAFLMVLRLKNEVLALNALKEMWGDIRRREDNADASRTEAIYRQRYQTPAILFERPRILGHAYDLVTDELARTKKIKLSLETMQTLVHKIEVSIAEERSLINYMSGLLVFMGLIGTFMGLLKMVGSIGGILGSLQAAGGGATDAFQKLLTDLQQPLAGMTTGFASSLFGLMGSLVVGLLARFAGSAASALKVEFESWLAGVVDLGEKSEVNTLKHGYLVARETDPALAAMVERLVDDYHSAQQGFERTEIAVKALMTTQQQQTEAFHKAFAHVGMLAENQAAAATAIHNLSGIVSQVGALGAGLERFNQTVDRRLAASSEDVLLGVSALGQRQNEQFALMALEQRQGTALLAEALEQNRNFAATIERQMSAFVSETSGLIASEREALRNTLAQNDLVVASLRASFDDLPQIMQRTRAESDYDRKLIEALDRIAAETRVNAQTAAGVQNRTLAEARHELDQATSELRSLQSILSRSSVMSAPPESPLPAPVSRAELNPFERSMAAIQDAFRNVLNRGETSSSEGNNAKPSNKSRTGTGS